METSTLILLLSGLSLGLLHAFDADHIMAVSSLSDRKFSAKKLALFCGRWALGHGATLMLLAMFLFLFNWQLNESASIWAERIIGTLLVTVGTLLVIQMIVFKNNVRFSTHVHEDRTRHTHLVKTTHHEHHLPVLVGIIHGVAGSSPLLAFLPSLLSKAPSIGMIYVIAFSFGVLLSMLIFGLLLGHIQQKLLHHSEMLFRWAKGTLGLATSVLGIFWIISSIS